MTKYIAQLFAIDFSYVDIIQQDLYFQFLFQKMLRVLSVIVCCLIISSHAYKCDYQHTKRAELEGIQKWPDNTIFYEIDEVYPPSERQLIVESLDELSTKTGNCVRFVPRTSQPDYVRVLSKTG